MDGTSAAGGRTARERGTGPTTDPVMPGPGLGRTTAQISAITGVARALGFARWAVFGLTVGATYLGNTYQTANVVPNILYELAAGGVLSAVFVPMFVEQAAAGRRREEEVGSTLANLFVLASLPVVVGGMLLARPIMLVFTSGVDDPQTRAAQVEIGSWFLLFFLPQVPLYLLGMVARAMAHAHDRFALAAASPAFSSIVVIATYIVFYLLGPGADLDTVTDAQRWVLAVGTTAGIAAWTLVQLVPLARAGLRWRPVLRVSDPAVRRGLRATAHGAGYYAVTQVGVIVLLVLANRVEGGVVAWQLAFAFYEVPNAVGGFPFAVALQPSLARSFFASDERAFGRLLSRGWRGTTLVLVPAAAAMFALARPFADLVAEVAARAAPALTASALAVLALGLPAYALQQTLVRALYARGATVAPIVMNAAAVSVLVAVAVAAVASAGDRGGAVLSAIGAGHAAGQWAGLAAGAVLVRRVAPEWTLRSDTLFLGVTVGQAALLAGVAVAVLGLTTGWPGPAALTAAATAAAAVYAVSTIARPSARRALTSLRAGPS